MVLIQWICFLQNLKQWCHIDTMGAFGGPDGRVHHSTSYKLALYTSVSHAEHVAHAHSQRLINEVN